MSETKRIILCPGQGSQCVGMGRAWFDASPSAAQTFGAADEILGDSLGEKLSTLCFEGPEDRLNKTDVAQPALFVCGVASFQALFSGETKDAFDAMAGLSLGEYTALHLAGALSFEDGLRLVALRGKAMQEAAEASDGGMVAVIGAEEDAVSALCDAARGNGVLVPANFNAPGQIVISGSGDACDRAVVLAGERGMRVSKLTVAGAFHSPLMSPAADRLRAALASVEMRSPSCVVVSNVTAEPHGEDPSSIAERLVEQLTSPVRWSQSCGWLAGRYSGSSYHELAPGKVLSGLMRRIERSIKVENHDSPS